MVISLGDKAGFKIARMWLCLSVGALCMLTSYYALEPKEEDEVTHNNRKDVNHATYLVLVHCQQWSFFSFSWPIKFSLNEIWAWATHPRNQETPTFGLSHHDILYWKCFLLCKESSVCSEHWRQILFSFLNWNFNYFLRLFGASKIWQSWSDRLDESQ